jgi:tetratricopeptide (TPR) repeat protein
MEEKRNELKTNAMRSDKSMAAIQFSELEKRQEIDVPALGLSLNMVIAQLRRMLGIKQRRVGGDVVVREGKLYLTLRITGQPDMIFSSENDENPESVIKTAAKHVIETFEPLSFGLSYCLNQNDEALEKLIKYRQKTRSHDKSEEVVTLTLEACLLKNQQAFMKALDKLAQAEKYDRKNSIVFYVKGNTLQSYGDYNENNRSASVGTLASLMLAIINNSYPYDEAILAYQTAIIYEPKNGGIYTQWARTLIKKANQQEDNVLKQTLLKKAFAKYQIASEKEEKNPWVYTDWGDQLAKVYHQSSLSEKMFEKAEEKFRKAIDVDPYYALAYATWGDVLLKFQKSYKKATQKYEKAVELNFKAAWVYGNWGVALLNQKKYQAAIVKFETAIKLKKEAWIYKEWGKALVKLKRYKEAVTKYENSLTLAPDAGIYYELGKALVKLKQYKEAIVQYEKAVALAPDKRDKRRYYYVLGDAFSQLGQYEQAIIRYQNALAIEPEHIWSHIFMGYAYVKVQKPEEAFTECETVLKSPHAKEAQKAAAYALCGLAEIGFKRPESAIKQCQTALTISEREDWAYWCLGDALVLLNKLEEAVIQYEKAANLKPDNTFYYYKWEQAFAKSEQAAITQDEKAK